MVVIIGGVTTWLYKALKSRRGATEVAAAVAAWVVITKSPSDCASMLRAY